MTSIEDWCDADLVPDQTPVRATISAGRGRHGIIPECAKCHAVDARVHQQMDGGGHPVSPWYHLNHRYGSSRAV